MKIKRVYQKVRKNATRKWSSQGKTSLPNEKDWSPESSLPPSSEFSTSAELSTDGFDVQGLPRIEEKREEPKYYRRSPRVVFFIEEILVRRVRPVYQIGGPIDRRELWYQDDEYKEIMWKARRLVKRAHNDDDNTNTEKYCLRGLEHVTNSIKRRLRSNLDGREAVLDEQCLQFEADVFPLDDNKIAAVYQPYTKAQRADAIERAEWDAKEVELYQQSPSSTSPGPLTSCSSHSKHTSCSSHSKHSSLHPITPKTPKRPSLSASSLFTSPKSPVSPSLVNKPGMMFTYVDKKIQYPEAMRLETI
jgi:hypothetical protein